MRKSKDDKNNTTTTITPLTSNETPIEIALQIDKDGMTTASKLYAFLELLPSNFARWCKKNIVNNKFATENEDYFPFIIQEERDKPKNPKPKTDYKLTSEFAKKLSMTGNTEKHEQARNYFIACEQGLKIATAKLQARNDDIQALAQSVNNLVQKIDNKFDSLEARISTLENTTPKSLPKKQRFTYWQSKMFPKYQLLTDYFNISNRELYKELFRELQNTYPDIDLNQIIDDYCYENHLDTCFTLDAIEHNKEIRTLYETMVDNLLAKYNLTENLSDTKYKTIFDNQ